MKRYYEAKDSGQIPLHQSELRNGLTQLTNGLKFVYNQEK